MQFFAAASLFAAAALAAPAPQTTDCPNPAHCGTPITNYENIDISDFFVRKDDRGIQSVDFKLSGKNATNLVCSIGATGLPSEQTQCTTFDNPYSFKLYTGLSLDGQVELTIFHQTGDV